jgi:hypothetical protein|tara:strand:+ start:436 stop:936 length:501 start_codon:yes stop_codon:yes gene_type:complete
MNNVLDIQLLPILVALGFLSIVTLWTIIKYYKNSLIVAILIPLTIISFTTTYITLERVLGYPIDLTIPEESIYLSHIVSDYNNVIYVWILEPSSTIPRSIIIPLTKENKEQMRAAKKRQASGIPQMIRKGGENLAGIGQTKGGDYVLYNFQVADPENLKETKEDTE